MAVTVKENVNPEVKLEEPKDILENHLHDQKHHEMERMKMRREPEILEISWQEIE